MEHWTPKQRRFDTVQEWLLARRQFMMASDSQGILNQGYANQCPMTVYQEKTSTAPPEDAEEQENFMIGHWMEPVLKKVFQHREGIDLRMDRTPVIRISREHEWLGATLDSHFYKRKRLIPVEFKTVDQFLATEWEKGVPLKVQIQVQHQIAVCNAPYGWVLAWAGPSRIYTRRIARDQPFIDALVQKLHEFHCHVKTKSPPPADFTKACETALNLLHPDDNGLAIELPASSTDIAKELIQAEEYSAAIEKAIRHRKNILRAMLGDYTYGIVPGIGIYSWKTQEKQAYTVKASKTRVFRKIKSLPKAAEVVPNPYLEDFSHDSEPERARIDGPCEVGTDDDIHPYGGDAEYRAVDSGS